MSLTDTVGKCAAVATIGTFFAPVYVSVVFNINFFNIYIHTFLNLL